MTSRERVLETIHHRKPDRIPLNGWLGNEEFAPKVVQRFGSLAAAHDHYEFDIAGVPCPTPFPWCAYHDLREARKPEPITAEDILDIPLTDPDSTDIYVKMKEAVEKNNAGKCRFTIASTHGYFENFSAVFGLETQLINFALYPDAIRILNTRMAEWNKKFANNALDVGVDMIHFSDDWGAQRSLIFDPKQWWELVYPFHADVVGMIHKRGGLASLHSDGCVAQVLDGIAKIGFDVVHPFQESAGMDLSLFKRDYMDTFTVMGGLDVQTTIGFGKYDFLKSEIERIVGMFRNGGLIFCTSHSIQPHCTVEEFVFAYDLVYDLIRKS